MRGTVLGLTTIYRVGIRGYMFTDTAARNQRKLFRYPDSFENGLFCLYSFRPMRKFRATLQLNVSNLLDKQEVVPCPTARPARCVISHINTRRESSPSPRRCISDSKMMECESSPVHSPLKFAIQSQGRRGPSNRRRVDRHRDRFAWPGAESGPSLLVISIDGLRPDYVLQADQHGLKVPRLRALQQKGAYATGVQGVLPTATYPSHTTIVTGVTRRRTESSRTTRSVSSSRTSIFGITILRKFGCRRSGKSRPARLHRREHKLAGHGWRAVDSLEYPRIRPHAHAGGREDHARRIHSRIDGGSREKGGPVSHGSQRGIETRLVANPLRAEMIRQNYPRSAPRRAMTRR